MTAVFAGMGAFVLWDYKRVAKDFSALKTLLEDARYQAATKDQALVVRFLDDQVEVTDKVSGEIIGMLSISTLNQVNYDTTLGDNMIVFNGRGTSDFNKRVHGGDIRLRSWFAFERNIAVNCTGLVTEGVYPNE